ncbi:hypothetical protein BN946_scf184707.g9 [Trametes cinnabarina]|uniref:EthD domain-containing protein n=1 Tax=Pycnoporus cinnabarinus TaxID=5643 RepID=A0A060S7R2_PYCCI|nr:hypothetical protein BN946_scf184707.g9 [Trametes cinnabarina]
MPGLLLVCNEPGSAVSTEEFNDWYDHEHVPLFFQLQGFHSWSRWIAADGRCPAYCAIYDVSSTDILAQPAAVERANNRSERDKAICASLSLLDVRMYELLEPNHTAKEDDAYDPAKPGPVMSIVEFEVKPEVSGAEGDMNRWYDEEHVLLLSKIPGWVRSRRFVLVNRTAMGPWAEDERQLKYLVIHEWESADVFERPDFKAAWETEWTKRVLENVVLHRHRRLTLMRAWDRK